MAARKKTYVALLRGINVGGKSKVAMPQLRTVFSDLGCSDVTTYINSGNVIFRDTRRPAELLAATEKGIAKEFGFPVDVVLRDLAAMRKLVREIPAEWTNDREQKTDVLFLREGADRRNLLDSISFDVAIENVLHLKGAIVWNVARKNAGRAKLVKLVGTELYRQLTIRNVNTARKLLELMDDQGPS